jgi:hypothetical protein
VPFCCDMLRYALRCDVLCYAAVCAVQCSAAWGLRSTRCFRALFAQARGGPRLLSLTPHECARHPTDRRALTTASAGAGPSARPTRPVHAAAPAGVRTLCARVRTELCACAGQRARAGVLSEGPLFGGVILLKWPGKHWARLGVGPILSSCRLRTWRVARRVRADNSANGSLGGGVVCGL